MAKKFTFNQETLDFDVARRSLVNILQQALLWILGSMLFLMGYYVLFSRFFSTPEEQQLAKVNYTLNQSYTQLNKQYEQLQKVVSDLNQRDVNIYRRIFESDPLQPGKAEATLNNANSIEHTGNIMLTQQSKDGIDRLSVEVDRQTAFLKKIVELNKNNTALQALPSIQPVQNNDLRRTAASYGMRIHPFYKVLKMHHGMDFTAPLGDNVFATGNARVDIVKNDMRGSGLTIVLDHGNGYKTTYAHLHRASVKVGDRVKRGSVIGLVGNSGRSVAPHLHYGVEKNGHSVNPLHYFFQDVTPDKYQQLISLAGNKGQPLD